MTTNKTFNEVSDLDEAYLKYFVYYLPETRVGEEGNSKYCKRH